MGPGGMSARNQALLSATEQERTRSMGYRELHAQQRQAVSAVAVGPGENRPE